MQAYAAYVLLCFMIQNVHVVVAHAPEHGSTIPVLDQGKLDRGEFPLPPHWESAPRFEELPRDKSGVPVVDAWVFEQRMGAYKELVLRTTEKYPCLFPSLNSNILWGLPLQLGWQFSTGRLFVQPRNGTGPGNFSISEDSWWASMNYMLSIIPALGARRAGTIGLEKSTFRVAPAKQYEYMFCTDEAGIADSGCAQLAPALESWKAFFQSLPAANHRACTAGGRNKTAWEKEYFESLFKMWEGHTASLRVGMDFAPVKAKLLSLPREEAKFGVSWGRLVEFLAEARFRTNFDDTSRMQQILPTSVLSKGWRKRLFFSERTTYFGIVAMETLASMNHDSDNELLKLWKLAMCSPASRKDARFLINQGLIHPSVLIPGMIKLVADAMIPGKTRDCHSGEIADQ